MREEYKHNTQNATEMLICPILVEINSTLALKHRHSF